MTDQLTNRQVSEVQTQHVSFDVVDEKGRIVGAFIETSVVTYTLFDGTEGPYRGGWRHAPGVFFGFEPHATRNGKNYGASQSLSVFDTAEARDAAIAKYLKTAKARAAKKVAK